MNSKNVNQSKICLKENGVTQFEPKNNANIFKTFNSELAGNLVKRLPKPPLKFNSNKTMMFYKKLKPNLEKFELVCITEEKIKKLLCCLDVCKAPGMDEIFPRFLKDGAEMLQKSIYDIINLSKKLSTFPDKCKIAKLTRLFKKGSKIDPKNPLISKLIEKAIHIQTQEYLDKNGLIYKFQSGFRKKFSTDSCLVQLTYLITKGMDKGQHTGMTSIDLKKAFDTLDHDVLLEKMECVGFKKPVIEWFKSYLSNREFVVSIEGVFSEESLLICEVPQGSILGPLLFLIYINDLSQSLSESASNLYAHDTCIYYQLKDIQKIENALNKEFSFLCEWFISNKLSIHFGEDKTKAILFTRSKTEAKLNICFQDHSIKQYNCVEYLGFLLNNNLCGESMARKALKKINGKLKFLYREAIFLNSACKRLLCNALIQTHFDYGYTSWYPLLSKAFKKRFQIAQNKCIRYCLDLPPRTHISAIHFRKINWLPAKHRVVLFTATTMFKLWNQLTPSYFEDIFKPSFNKYYTRSQMALDIPLRKTTIGQKSIPFLGPKVSPKTNNSLKAVKTTTTFTHALKKHVLENLII